MSTLASWVAETSPVWIAALLLVVNRCRAAWRSFTYRGWAEDKR